MKIKSAEIKNFRGIEDETINFDDNFNLIKGVNGKGKTSLLEALAIGLGGFISRFNDVGKKHLFSQDDIRKIVVQLSNASIDVKYITPAKITLNTSLYEKDFTWTTCGKDNKTVIRTGANLIWKEAIKLKNDSEAELPIILYQGADRIWNRKKSKNGNIFRQVYSRSLGYKDALSNSSNIELLLNWCAKMEMVAWQKEEKIAEYEAVKKAAADFMGYISNSGNYRVFYDKISEEIMYQKDDFILPISNLSAGYQSLIWMVLDIAYRMAVLNPQKGKEITSTRGVVLIDELDMHLHPQWQWNVIDALRKTFPNVQFITATHSPILFASAKDVRIIDIEEKDISYRESHYGIDINTSLENYQETPKEAPEISKYINKCYDTIDNNNLEEAESIIKILEEKVSPESPSLVKLKTYYDLELIDLED